MDVSVLLTSSSHRNMSDLMPVTSPIGLSLWPLQVEFV